MNVYFYEPFETHYHNNFSNSEFNLKDISVFTVMKQKFPNYEKDINAWLWIRDLILDIDSKKKIKFIIDNWSDKLIEDIEDS